MTPSIYEKTGGGSEHRGEYLKLVFSPSAAPVRSRWRNNGLSADFLGDYVTTFLPNRDSSSAAEKKRAEEVSYAVAYISNELLENAMKYHDRLADVPIRIQLELQSDQITISASNGVCADQAEIYKAFVSRILREDPASLLEKQVELSAQQGTDVSCVGLLTILNDYRAKLGCEFDRDPVTKSRETVTTTAILRFEDF